MGRLLAAMILVAAVTSRIVKFDKDAVDDADVRSRLIEKHFEGHEEIQGKKVRELVFEYFADVGVDNVESEMKRLKDEGVMKDDDFISYYSIMLIDFYMETNNLVNLTKERAVEVLNRNILFEKLQENMQEFSDRMINDMTDMINAGKMVEPPMPEAPEGMQGMKNAEGTEEKAQDLHQLNDIPEGFNAEEEFKNADENGKLEEDTTSDDL